MLTHIKSIKDQTLDQQCTVTRPGIAAIASALLVELFVSVLQHPDGPAAPASSPQQESHADHPLGIIPHQIRGFLSNFSNLIVSGKSYNCCSACSGNITDAYKQHGWAFVSKAVNERGYVEELSGLKEVSLPLRKHVGIVTKFHRSSAQPKKPQRPLTSRKAISKKAMEKLFRILE